MPTTIALFLSLDAIFMPVSRHSIPPIPLALVAIQSLPLRSTQNPGNPVDIPVRPHPHPPLRARLLVIGSPPYKTGAKN